MIRSRSFSSVRLFVLAPTVDRRHIPDSEGSKRIFCEKFEEQVENWKGQSRQFPLRATLAQHCDHMARWFVSFWTFTTMKICPIPRQHNKFGKVGSKICQILKNVRFLAKSGHTASFHPVSLLPYGQRFEPLYPSFNASAVDL